MKYASCGSLVASAVAAFVLGGSVASAQGMNIPVIEATPVLEGLESPWDMSVHADGTMFFTETMLA